MAYMGLTVTIWDSWSDSVDKLSPSLLFFFNMDTISDWLNFILPFVVVFRDFLRACLGDKMLLFLKFTVDKMAELSIGRSKLTFLRVDAFLFFSFLFAMTSYYYSWRFRLGSPPKIISSKCSFLIFISFTAIT